MRWTGAVAVAVSGLALWGCEGSAVVTADGGLGGGGGASPDAVVPDSPLQPVRAGIDQGCPDLFTQDSLRRYDVEISVEDWERMMAEFRAGPPQDGTPKTLYPLTSFRYGDEVRTDAAIRLKGGSSWTFAVANDPNPKAQFVIAFDKRGAKVPFHGVDRIVFDMPRSDRSMLHERLARALQRVAGLPTPCANSAELYINGTEYGVYVAMEDFDQRLLDRLFPGASDGPLLKYGMRLEENSWAVDLARLDQLWAATDFAAMAPLVDVETSLRVWATEVAINDADGYWGGDHNFYLYDHPQRGFVWLSADMDASFDWIGDAQQHPIYWWARRFWAPAVIPQHYLAVIADPGARGRFVEAIRAVMQIYEVDTIQGWVDDWSAQIAEAVARDAHLPFSVEQHQAAVAAARQSVASRAEYVRAFLECASGAGGDNQDQDGVAWCNDCDDTRADVYPGATEVCGDGIDQDCDSVLDDGC